MNAIPESEANNATANEANNTVLIVFDVIKNYMDCDVNKE